MTEIGGPTAQAGIRYQDRVAALYMGRMIDPRQRPRRDRPIEVRVESPVDVDDFVVRYDDGSQRYFQVKLALERRGEAWKSLWSAMYRQLKKGLSPDDRLSLVIGEPSTLASNLQALTARTDGADREEWFERLTTEQQKIASSIAQAVCVGTDDIFQIFCRLNVSVWPATELERDYVPLWMPDASVPAVQLFQILVEIVWTGSETRSRFDGAGLRDRLNAESGILIAAPSSWGLDRYCAAVVALADIEVPGTGFRQSPGDDFLWPRCLRYDRHRQPDFDDDLPGWRDLSAREEVDLRDFPSIDLNNVVVVAGPGFGKSTLVTAVSRRTVVAGFVPAIISVTKFSDSNLTIGEYLERVINTEFEVRIDWTAAAATGALVLFIDGLDEVSSDRRVLVLERLKVYRAAHPSIRWMLTVRDAAAFAAPEGATMIELAPLRNADIVQYVAFYRPDEPGLAGALLTRIESRTDLAHLVRIPIFLALMLVMRLEGEDLRRSDLLDTYIEILFQPAVFKHTESETVEATSLKSIAEFAAFKSLESDSIGVTNQLFATCVKHIAPTVSVTEVRGALIRRGVLRPLGLTRLSFPFPIVQEYLASAELLGQPTDSLMQRLSMIFRRPWAQAVQFALERHPSPEPLISQILAAEDDVFYTGLRLLGRCLANGMLATPTQRDEIGRKLALIWGRSSWRTNKLINGIIVDAFAVPLHSAVKARLSELELLHEGSGVILSLNRDAGLTISVLREMLAGEIELPLNIGELQGEIDRIGTKAFEFYVERCRIGIGSEDVANSISCLIGHMRTGGIDADVAYVAASDATLPLQVRLVAWSKSQRKLDIMMESLIIDGMMAEDYHHNASAAQALSSPTVDALTIVRLLGAPGLPDFKAEKILDYLIADWRGSDRRDRIQSLLDVDRFTGRLRNLVLLYAINEGNLKALDYFVLQIAELSSEMVGAVVSLLGHAPDRSRVEQIVAAIASRTLSVSDRVSITSAFATGLTYRMKMFGMRSGVLEPIAPHPGRSVPYELLGTWLTYDDYSPIERLRMAMDTVRLGVPNAVDRLRPALDAILIAGVGGDNENATLAARAIETLHANGKGLSLDELEQLARQSTYNLAVSAVGLISAGGSESEANILLRLYEEVRSKMLRLVILSYLEPLASRLGIRITWNDDRLIAVKA